VTDRFTERETQPAVGVIAIVCFLGSSGSAIVTSTTRPASITSEIAGSRSSKRSAQRVMTLPGQISMRQRGQDAVAVGYRHEFERRRNRHEEVVNTNAGGRT